MSWIMCDVNGMKVVNDTYGHQAGDELLCRVAYILRNCVRDEDLVARWAGDVYPEGLVGKEIPLLARIISIVDAYDVMTTGRPYKEPMSKEEALAEIKRCAGSQFDLELAEEFVNMMMS